MHKATNKVKNMKKIGLGEYAFTFLSCIVPGLSNISKKYDEIDRDTHIKHLETEAQVKETIARMDSMIAAYEKKHSDSRAPSIG